MDWKEDNRQEDCRQISQWTVNKSVLEKDTNVMLAQFFRFILISQQQQRPVDVQFYCLFYHVHILDDFCYSK